MFVKIVAWHPFVIAGARSIVAGLFLCAVQLCTRKKGAPFLAGIKTLPAWLAGIAYCGTMILFVTANKLTASANVIVLQYTAPIWSALFGALLIREKPKAEHWISLVFIFTGLYVMLKDSLMSGGITGDILAVCSGILFGTTSVFMRMQKDANPQDGMILSHILTAAICVPFFFTHTPRITGGAALSIFFMGVFQIGTAAILYSYGIKRVSAVSAMLISAIEPLFNPVWVFLATDEMPHKTTFAGGSLILAAVLLANIVTWRREGREQSHA
jgi:drug/metabolite transporter (DMT)-like permease